LHSFGLLEIGFVLHKKGLICREFLTNIEPTVATGATANLGIFDFYIVFLHNCIVSREVYLVSRKSGNPAHHTCYGFVLKIQDFEHLILFRI